MQQEIKSQAGERTHTGTITAAQFSEEQYTQRRRNEVATLIESLERLLETERSEYCALEDAMARNQELPTPEERNADGFPYLYNARAESESRACNFKNALAALRSI